ncbi:MAG: hypothetical protein M1821_006928 [Bathelium mastoideum]|nr:MAG: hypothetical protein M1821_006928 [Bathelium mastoideum]
MASLILRIMHLGQAAVAGYGLYLSYISITNLQKYEKRSEQAARHSRSAADQLFKTRTTQGAGAIAILVSLLTSLWIAFGSGYPSSTKLTLSLANAAMGLFVRTYMLNFWQGSAKIPFLRGYNEALSKTGAILDLMVSLAVSWGVMGLAWASAAMILKRETRI